MTGDPVSGDPVTAYTLELTEDPRVFLDRAGTHLAADPVVSTVVTTVAHRSVRDDELGRPRPGHPRWWVTVVDGSGAVVGAAMRTAPFAPYPLYVLPMPDGAALALGRLLAERGEAGAGANGAVPAARLVAQEAARCAGGGLEAGRDSRLWILSDLRLPADPPGRARLATTADLDLVVAWFAAFHPAADQQAGHPPGSHPATVEPTEVERRVADECVWLWTDADGAPAHLTAYNPPSFGVARIGPVYTPEQHRGRGYAGATVGLVARLLRDTGAAVCLFTDADNLVSTHVYRRLGFQPVVDTADHRVVLPAG